ncbi:MAG: HNH endonuclease [Cyclobacteriaceae bacterium]|nr:HNH endonuclease [Cyclobacteriaceae bacterium]
MNDRVLILNADYSPMMICSIERAIVLNFLGKSELVHEVKGKQLRTVSKAFAMPLVIRLLKYIHIPYKTVSLTRLNVFKRDSFTCQYCEKKEHLTLDHVLPKSKGGRSTWNNLVTACSRCNSRKGNNTPTEVGMRLINMPFRPSYTSFLLHFSGFVSEEWLPYFNTKKRA